MSVITGAVNEPDLFWEGWCLASLACAYPSGFGSEKSEGSKD